MFDSLYREFVYISYYFEIQLRQILGWYLVGIIAGSAISVFLKDRILSVMENVGKHTDGIASIIIASILGIASPLCMYGTIPIAASLSRGGIRNSSLAAFMMSSILLNPQLIIYSFALGGRAVAIRLITCTLCGIVAGLLVKAYGKPFFSFGSMEGRASRDTDPNIFLRLLKNIGRNLKATGPYFLIGVLLSALFQRYVPSDLIVK